MHRATPGNSSFRSYSAGGTRSAMDSVTDTTQMQEMAGNFMSGETRKAVEAMQNYGFTSVTMDSIKSKLGSMVASAETAISFMGGNRSFPVAGNTDDRRHRLNSLDKGDSGMFGTQGMKQQFHMSNSDGMFGTVPQDKTMRMALLDEDSEKDGNSQSFQQGQSGGGGNASAAAVSGQDFLETDRDGVTRFVHVDRQGLMQKFLRVFPLGITNYSHVVALADGGGGGGAGGAGGAGGGTGMKMGQKSLKDKNQKAGRFFDITKDQTRAAGKLVQLVMSSSSGGGGGGGGSSRLNLPVDYVYGDPKAGSSGGSGGSSGGSSQNQGTVLAEVNSDSNFYCGGSKQKGKFALIVTVKGPTKNVPGRIG